MKVETFSLKALTEVYVGLVQGYSEPDFLALNSKTREKFVGYWSDKPVNTMRFRNASVETDENLPNGVLHLWQEKKNGVHNSAILEVAEWQ